jgi:hypothetical protein
VGIGSPSRLAGTAPGVVAEAADAGTTAGEAAHGSEAGGMAAAAAGAEEARADSADPRAPATARVRANGTATRKARTTDAAAGLDVTDPAAPGCP